MARHDSQLARGESCERTSKSSTPEFGWISGNLGDGFKWVICDDVSEFESYMPSQAVRVSAANVHRPVKMPYDRGISQIRLGLRVRNWRWRRRFGRLSPRAIFGVSFLMEIV
jgi:hypothetical protein